MAEGDANGQPQLLCEDLCFIVRGAIEAMAHQVKRPRIHEHNEFGARLLSTDCAYAQRLIDDAFPAEVVFGFAGLTKAQQALTPRMHQLVEVNCGRRPRPADVAPPRTR